MKVVISPTKCVLLMVTVALMCVSPSTAAISIANLTVFEVTTTSAKFTWLVNGLKLLNDTDSLRTYIDLRFSLNFLVDEGCLDVNTTSMSFESMQPYALYIACVSVVSLEERDVCDSEESPRVSTNEECVALTTEFATFSYMNIAAIGCAAFIIIAVILALIIKVAVPEKTVNNTVDTKKMRDWSKKKRTESCKDFLESVNATDEDLVYE